MVQEEEGPKQDSCDEVSRNQHQSVRVVVRVRPLLANEEGATTASLALEADGTGVRLTAATARRKAGTVDERHSRFSFDAVLACEDDQEAVFAKAGVPRLVEAALDGFDATIFAYGQTGSGKTHTMEGFQYDADARVDVDGTPEARLGLVPRTARALFEAMAARASDHGDEFHVTCSHMQIYNEKILDLLRQCGPRSHKPNSTSRVAGDEGLRLRFDGDAGRFYAQSLLFEECEDASDVLRYFERGVASKVMGSHNLNAASSRSHCVFTLVVETMDSAHPNEPRLTSRFNLVDLAGSERVSLTGAQGHTFKEATCINQSLFALRNVITAIAAKQAGSENAAHVHVPFRDSKLTSLLQHSLGGTSLTTMIACVSPSDAHTEENLSTLVYAAKAKQIRNRPVRNEDPKTVLVRALRREIKLLRTQLQQAQDVSAMNLAVSDLGHGARSPLSSAAAANVGIETSPDAPEAGAGSGRGMQGLKRKLLSSIGMMKRMHEVELELRSRMERAERRGEAAVVENAQLQAENQRLREQQHQHELVALLHEGERAVGSKGGKEVEEGKETARQGKSPSRRAAAPRRPPPLSEEAGASAPAASDRRRGTRTQTQAQAQAQAQVQAGKHDSETRVMSIKQGRAHAKSPGKRKSQMLSVKDLRALLTAPRSAISAGHVIPAQAKATFAAAGEDTRTEAVQAAQFLPHVGTRRMATSNEACERDIAEDKLSSNGPAKKESNNPLLKMAALTSMLLPK